MIRQYIQRAYVGYRGRASYLSHSQREEIIKWIQKQDLLSVQRVRDHIEEKYGILYRSKQSYYQLLSEAGMSYHRTTPLNPKRDEGQVKEKREEIKKSGGSSRGDRKGRNRTSFRG